MSGELTQGVVDTNILILRDRIDVAELPDEIAISAMTLAELSAGPHQVRSDSRDYDEHSERERCIDSEPRTSSIRSPSTPSVPASLVASSLTSSPQAEHPGAEPSTS